ncbi:ABC transporter substrate-binding protein [Mycobacterium sp. 21AC1]|uniref:ABC transporter substrate-binding protein n=1 Tax=[Mycobacterium] appelbergii TaxID=2939269 RepID=UPI0029390DAB|nr:ABC transporter substrate-binding protein [Mycobacterium sp. 21AC1]MDV3128423.1 ABC transporter substrate-binding protein [Mycobacterium sp. 21AC1]
MKITTITAIAMVMIATSACTSQSDNADGSSGTKTIGIFNQPSTYRAGSLTGKFVDLDIKTAVIDSGPAALPLLKRGDLAALTDVVGPTALIAHGNNVASKIVWVTSDAIFKVVGGQNVRSAQDLVGKKVAVVPGSILEYALISFLDKNGMNIDQLQIVDLAPESQPAALRTGQIDAAVAWEPASTDMLAAGANELGSQRDPQFVMVSQAFIDDDPEFVQKFVCNYAASQTAMLKDPDAAYTAMQMDMHIPTDKLKLLLPVEFVLDPNAALTQLSSTPEKLSPLGETLVAEGQYFAAQGKIPAAPSPSEIPDFFDKSFAENTVAGKC